MSRIIKMIRENWLRSSATPTSAGPRPDAKRSTRNVQTMTHGLIQDGIPPLSSAVTPFWPSDLPLTSSPRPSQHTPVWHPEQSIYNCVTPIKYTLTEYTLLLQEGIHTKALSHSLFSLTQKSTNSEITKWKSLHRRIKGQARWWLSIKSTH